MNKKGFVFLTLLAHLLLASCIPLIPVEAPLSATATPAILADCFPLVDVLAWLDENGDGIWNDGESPLAGIEFRLTLAVYGGHAVSDENGLAHISAMYPGECLEMQQIVAVSFSGYTLTTPIVLDYLTADTEYLFGFQPDPVAILPTPAPTISPMQRRWILPCPMISFNLATLPPKKWQQIS